MSRFLNSYVSQVLPALRRQFPGVPEAELKQMVQEEAGAAFSDRSALFHNDATMPHEDLEGSCHPLTFLQWADFVLGKNRPVLTTFGCCYKRHDEARNLVAEMLQHFIDTRKLAKKKMFQHANDADRSERDRWDRVQRVVKILNNSYYGASGERNSWFFNARIGPSVTYTGQTIITTSILAFEQFLAGNAPFGKPGVPGTALSEALMFVERSLAMGSEEGRGFTDVTDLELTHEGVATHLFHRMREVAPGDAEAIGRALSGLTLQELSSVYYRNNLWKFLDGAPVRALVCSIVDSGEAVDADKPSAAVLPALEELWSWVRQYVFYPWTPEDKSERCARDVRKVVIVSDTDSCFLNIQPWMDYLAGRGTSHGGYDVDAAEPQRVTDMNGIMIYLINRMIRETYDHMTAKMGVPEDKRPIISMKNELTFSRVMLTANKKQYAGVITSQEGHAVDPPKLDVKGLSIKKTTTNRESRDYFVKLLEREILRSEGPPDRGRILGLFAEYEARVRSTLAEGKTDYAVPARYSNPKTYKNMERIPVVRGVAAWNAMHPKSPIAFGEKVGMLKMRAESLEDLEPLADSDPDKYDALVRAIWTPWRNAKTGEDEPNMFAKFGMSVLAVPLGISRVPAELLPFVDADSIASDNVRNALVLLESLGLRVMTILGDDHYSNVLAL